MALATIKPTWIDTAIADVIAAHTDDDVEDAAEALTWGADEHVLLALAAGWLYAAMPATKGDTTGSGEPCNLNKVGRSAAPRSDDIRRLLERKQHRGPAPILIRADRVNLPSFPDPAYVLLVGGGTTAG
ncbi:hypothetical protein [Bradyrhizobium japonicum]|jgi:hypothetical protein|uniref:Uncharacterized protein n=1 Tax=Bradyrhizobium japonicum TaxID=375 RepID=A0ABV2S1W1_BRAJP|nr:hypothetical protein [Bradyrhizobium japonicum]MCP1767167.1 hypothetical protein [Bradyrhizobium japonicum]MCP1789306.1 hypothetical protein [Bradyrhizobium japonicum]MCP1801805.1 hypothetical protein [Bradyrhizobium japonicum]MCP1820116.1 hypothetical protein [Bradyrhizobium japonicum]MCP1868376.1 hypothetical protein [Bradyrhizobium japonicum]